MSTANIVNNTPRVTADNGVGTGLTKDADEANQSGSAPANATNKASLLRRARDAIEVGDQSLHEAAEALALAQQDFKASQREIAEAVGKSVAWVNRLLRWQREGCEGSPFGPGSKARRARQKSVQAPEQRAVDADSAEASTIEGKTEDAVQGAEPNLRARRELTEIKQAIDTGFPHMDKETRREAIEYAVAMDKSCANDN
jgi:hypothetical protein